MANVLMHAPTSGNTSVSFNGRKYSAAPGAPLNVPDFDAAVLEANGWHRAGDTGTTAQRPANPTFRQTFQDSTVGAQIFWDGKAWRHSTTGATV